MQALLTFVPLYQERVWGGRALAEKLGRTLPVGDRPIGESWEIVDRPEAQSVVAAGPHAGRTLREVVREHTTAVMGPAWPATRAFPILVKWLDCRERLSLQVHPPAAVAPALKGEPKTENWYIADCTPGAGLIVGLRRGVTRAEFEEKLRTRQLEDCVHRFTVGPGDSILVQSGTVHAIDGGNLILEIQQNSDTTYRVYDWGRTGLDGKPRQLHVAESLASILWDVVEPEPIRAAATEATLADAAEFRLRRVPLAAGAALRIPAGEQARLVSIAAGEVQAEDGTALPLGSTALVPYTADVTLTAGGAGATLIFTENFAR